MKKYVAALSIALFLTACENDDEKEQEIIKSPAPTDSLLADYKFSGNANDDSGLNNHGIAHNVILVGDRNNNMNSAYQFNGVDSYIETTIERSSYSEFTMCAWYKYNGAVVDGYQSIFSGDTTDFWVGKHRGNSSIGVQEVQYDSAVAVGTNAWDGEWHHLCYVYSSGQITLYLDKNNVGTTSLGLGAGPLWIGRENQDAGYVFNGIIDDILIYGRVLSSIEVANLP